MKKYSSSILKFMSTPGNTKVIFVIDMLDYEKSASLSKFLKSLQPEKIVFLNSGLPHYFEGLKERDIKIKLEEDYLEPKDYEAIDGFAYRLTRNWYNGLTQYRGIELGRIVEYDFQLYLIGRLKKLQVIQSIIENDNPSGLIIISDFAEDYGGILRLIKNSYNVRVLPLFWKRNRILNFSDKKGFRGVVADLLTLILDTMLRISWIFLPNLNNKVLLDKRIYCNLADYLSMPNNFLPIPFEKGLRLRVNLLRDKMPYLPFYFPSYFSFRRKREALKKIKFLQRNLSKDICNFRGKSIWDIIEPKLEEYFAEVFRRISKNINLFEIILKRKKIKGIILNHDLWELQRLCVELGKKHGFPSLIVQHGVFGEKGEEIIFADKIAVWGRMCVDIYKDFGNDEKKCIVTGNPKHDDLYVNPLPRYSRNEICKELKIDPKKEIILLLSESAQNHLLSSYTNKDRGRIAISYLVKAMINLPGQQLVIKLHPFEDEDGAINDIVKYFNAKNVTWIKDIDLYSLINASGLVVTRESSATLKAMILKKPIITLNFEKRPEIVPFATYGASLGVYKPEDIFSAINNIFSDNSLREKLQERSSLFIDNYAHKIDGQSSERVFDFISEETKC